MKLVFASCIMQLIQDELLSEDVEKFRALDNEKIPPPLDNFKKLLYGSKQHSELSQKMLPAKVSINACSRDMYHYARVCRLHVLECIMDTALSAIKKQHIQEASNVRVQSYL